MKDTTLNGWKITRFEGNSQRKEEVEIATEFPLTIMLNGEEFATMVCSPSNFHELIVGFLASEGVIRFYDQITSVQIDEVRGFAYIEVNKPQDMHKHDHSKRFIGSCCGKSRQFYFKSDVKTSKTIVSRLSISVQQCFKLMDDLQSQSEQFKITGGVHNAALCTVNEILHTRTDVGRHNALDKIYGRILEDKLPLSDKLIIFSGRISSEVLLKISKIGVGIIISKSAPTDLALRLADDLGITAIGFARGNKLNVYTHPERIIELNE
ncbi:formate dehydrogenase accessory sulfurtransferase FdhD [Virgibacillus sp. C22-A2]|uniref:Sulfur carrier protein FdhD n=1 Tax=Virgibacillus tibetensis TaxID=3042313 RepID=A0ABU6KG14_9BACI|nr:formate dehydrogenase accessory sulfurtransferase FdhD [Virgibacillus sp. C22-A2]